MADNLTIKVVWDLLDKITKPLKSIKGESGATARALKDTRDRLKELNAQQKAVGEFTELKRGLKSTAVELRNAQQNARGIGVQLEALKGQTSPAAGELKKLTSEFNKANRTVEGLENRYRDYLAKNRQLRSSLQEAGISTRNLRDAQTWLKDSIAYTNAELSSQQKKLAAVTSQQERMASARQRMEKTQARAGQFAAAGIGATAAGAAIAMPIKGALQESKHFDVQAQRLRALGLGEKSNADALKFAADIKTYGTSQLENLELMRDAMTVFADEHHAQMVMPLLAKMKFANKAMYGEEQGGENERKFMDMLKVIEMRGGLSSEAAFRNQANTVQKVLTATGGRVGPEEWLNVIKTGGLAAKGMKDDAFYNQMEPLVQEMGGNRVGTAMMSAYQNLYQGRTTKRSIKMLDELGLIGDKTKVTHDKAGQVSFLNPGAIKGADLFRQSQFDWMEKILLPQLAAKGIDSEKGVLDAIGSIFSNRTASNMFSQMYLQRNQIHKNAALNRGAADIDTLNGMATNTATGKEIEATAKLHDLQLDLGNRVLPLYVSGLETVIGAVKAVTGFMERHETIAKVMMITFAALAGILLVVGPAMLAIASVLGPFAVLRFMLTAIGGPANALRVVLRLLGGAFRFAGSAVLWLVRALLMNPIGLTVTAIAAAAFLIYEYWGPIKGFFSGLWDSVKAAFSGGILEVAAMILNWSPLGMFYAAFAQVMSWFGVELPAKFSTFGANILMGLASGITSALGYVKDAVVSAGSSVIGWFKEKLGIRSPSRVFAELGDFTMQGLAQGMGKGQDGPLSQMGNLSKRLTQIGAGIAIGTAAMPAMSFDMRSPLSAGSSAASIDSHDTYQVIIQTAAGMDPQAIARAVSAELDRRDRAKQSRKRSGLFDYDN